MYMGINCYCHFINPTNYVNKANLIKHSQLFHLLHRIHILRITTNSFTNLDRPINFLVYTADVFLFPVR